MITLRFGKRFPVSTGLGVLLSFVKVTIELFHDYHDLLF